MNFSDVTVPEKNPLAFFSEHLEFLWYIKLSRQNQIIFPFL